MIGRYNSKSLAFGIPGIVLQIARSKKRQGARHTQAAVARGNAVMLAHRDAEDLKEKERVRDSQDSFTGRDAHWSSSRCVQ
jgi:hypothetical protein